MLSSEILAALENKHLEKFQIMLGVKQFTYPYIKNDLLKLKELTLFLTICKIAHAAVKQAHLKNYDYFMDSDAFNSESNTQFLLAVEQSLIQQIVHNLGEHLVTKSLPSIQSIIEATGLAKSEITPIPSVQDQVQAAFEVFDKKPAINFLTGLEDQEIETWATSRYLYQKAKTLLAPLMTLITEQQLPPAQFNLKHNALLKTFRDKETETNAAIRALEKGLELKIKKYGDVFRKKVYAWLLSASGPSGGANPVINETELNHYLNMETSVHADDGEMNLLGLTLRHIRNGQDRYDFLRYLVLAGASFNMKMPNGQTAGEYASTLSPEIVVTVNHYQDLVVGKEAHNTLPATRALYKRDNPVLDWLLTFSIFNWRYSEAVIVHAQEYRVTLSSSINRYFLDYVLLRNADTLRQRQQDAEALIETAERAKASGKDDDLKELAKNVLKRSQNSIVGSRMGNGLQKINEEDARVRKARATISTLQGEPGSEAGIAMHEPPASVEGGSSKTQSLRP